MGERECWINIYPKVYGERSIGLPHWTVASADKALIGRRKTADCLNAPAFRIHVRLKPEGAPARYASEGNRQAWERDPRMALWHAERGIMLVVEPWACAPRQTTELKTESA